MEGFTYNNIFDTKGIEYIVVIVFLTILVPFWFFLNKKQGAIKQIRKTVSALTAEVLQIPQGVFFNHGHTWAHLGKTGFARVGIDDFIVKVAGGLKVKQLKAPGDIVKKGEAIAEAYQDGKRLKIFSPLSGNIALINQNIEQGSSLLESNPYENGWLYDIKPKNWKAETQNSYLAEDATAWLKSELLRFKDFLSESGGSHTPQKAVVFQEGGELKMNPLSDMQSGVWDDFQKAFLNPNR